MSLQKISNPDDLLINASNPKLIEPDTIAYVMSFRNDGVAYSSILCLSLLRGIVACEI
jgi:hypothetical protein